MQRMPQSTQGNTEKNKPISVCYRLLKEGRCTAAHLEDCLRSCRQLVPRTHHTSAAQPLTLASIHGWWLATSTWRTVSTREEERNGHQGRGEPGRECDLY